MTEANRSTDDWKALSRMLKARWPALTENDLQQITSREQLVNHLQQRYSVSRQEAQQRVQEWLQGMEQKEFGEGNYVASREYNQAAREFVASGRVNEAARQAAPKDAAQARELECAEDAGRHRAKDEDPALYETDDGPRADKIHDPEAPREEPPADPNIDPIDPQKAPVPPHEPPDDGPNPPTRLRPTAPGIEPPQGPTREKVQGPNDTRERSTIHVPRDHRSKNLKRKPKRGE